MNLIKKFKDWIKPYFCEHVSIEYTMHGSYEIQTGYIPPSIFFGSILKKCTDCNKKLMLQLNDNQICLQMYDAIMQKELNKIKDKLASNDE